MIQILIVDDEKIERNGIKFLLKQLHMEAEIREAVNGMKALEALEESPADILLTDIKMPFMDGLELAENVMKKYPQTKMVIFSGYGEFEYARKAMKSGVDSYILKPVDPEEFRNTMEKVLQEIEGERLEDERKEKNRNFVREHVLLSLLNGAAPQDLAASLGGTDSLEYVQDFHNMMLLEFDREFFGRTGLDFLENLREEMKEPFLYLNMNPQQGIILLEQEIDVEVRKEMAQKLLDAIQEKYAEKCYIAVSREFERPVKLAEEMERLELLMENKFYVPEDRVFSEEQQTEANLSQIDDDALMKQIRQDIKMKDMAGLRRHFEGLCEKYHGKKNFSQMYVKFIFSNLLKDVYEILPKEKSGGLNQDIDRLYRTNDFQEVTEIINEGIKLLEQSFAINPQMEHREIETVKQYIYAHYGEELSVDMLADQVFLAPSYLSHIFKKETGQNLSKFIKALRMEKAKEMLEEMHPDAVICAVGADPARPPIPGLDNPKVITCKGGLDLRPEDMNVDADSLKTVFSGSPSFDAGEKTFSSVTREVQGEVLESYKAFVDFFLGLDAVISFQNYFGVPSNRFPRYREILLAKADEYLATMLDERGHEASRQEQNPRVGDALFFYPVCGAINALGYAIAVERV